MFTFHTKNWQSFEEKLWAILLLAGLAALFILPAMATRRFRAWRRPLATIFIVSALFSINLVIMFLCMQHTPQFMIFNPDIQNNYFNDYLFGGSMTALFLWVSWRLIHAPTKMGH